MLDDNLKQMGLSHTRGRYQEFQHCKISWSASSNPALPLPPHPASGMGNAHSAASLLLDEYAFLRMSFSYSLCFLARALILDSATSPRLWRRELCLVENTLLAFSAPLLDLSIPFR